MAFCAIGRGGVPDAAGAAPRAATDAVLLFRSRIPIRSRHTQSPAVQHETPSHLDLTITSDSTDHKITSDSTQTSPNPSVYVVSTEESRHVRRHRLVVVITIVTDVSK